MWRFLLRRLAGAMVVLAVVAVLVFVLTRMASGDPVALLLGDQVPGLQDGCADILDRTRSA